MIIIAGHLIVDLAGRDDYVNECVPVVEAARAAPGCLDFSITADSVDPTQIRIYERWESERSCSPFAVPGRATVNRRRSSMQT